MRDKIFKESDSIKRKKIIENKDEGKIYLRIVFTFFLALSISGLIVSFAAEFGLTDHYIFKDQLGRWMAVNIAPLIYTSSLLIEKTINSETKLK